VLWKKVISCGLAKKTKRNKLKKTKKKDCDCKYNPTAMLVVCGLQPAAATDATAAAEAEDDGIEEKTNKSKFQKNSEMLMIARLSH
jgi:hypothetical protein